MTEPSDFEDFLNRWDMQAFPDFDDKLRECEFFFALLSEEVDRSRFRWLLSGFLNAVYSFFETSALTAYFRYTDSDGDTFKDDKALTILRRNVGVVQARNNPNFVKTTGLSPLTRQLYEIRKRSTHHFSLSIMAAGPALPDDFQLGDMRGEGIPAVPLCREALELVRELYVAMND